MIRDLKELRDKRIEFVKDFVQQCTVREKIDAYYVSVEIQSKNSIVFKKSNRQEIDRSNMILNSMWSKLKNDWNYFKIVNEEWFTKHIGYTIHMFFFPCRKPILTEYKENTGYVIDRIVYGEDELDPETVMSGMKMLDEFHIKFNRNLDKKDMDVEQTAQKIMQHDSDIHKIFMDDVIVTDRLFAQDRPEGYVLRKGKHLYQIVFDKETERFIKSEKSQYEFLLMDFIKYWNTEELWKSIDNSYIKTVCLMFNSYIINKEQKTGYIENNIDITSIRNPYIGTRFPMDYDCIPDALTVSLCQENELYENIFKILLVNLKHEKKLNHCVLLNKKNIEEWNSIVKNMQTRCLSE